MFKWVILSSVLFCVMMNMIFSEHYFLTLNDQVQFTNPLLLAKQEVTATVESNTFDNHSKRLTNKEKKKNIAYATTVTSCSFSKKGQIDRIIGGAAVLHSSIKQAHQTSEFGYHMIVFIHPDGVDEYCRSMFHNLGYEVQIRETPFNESSVVNQELVQEQKNTCCGFKEYLKLYSYVQFQYPVVVHLDLDVMVLKPMDDLFRLMIYNHPDDSSNIVKAQWAKQPSDYPPTVDFAFTRDYPGVAPGYRQVHQVGVQGGFLVVRPNQMDFDQYIGIILQEKSYRDGMWGGRSGGYGGYWGDSSIQGLASYYAGEYAKNRSLELNRCYYNQMADDPLGRPHRGDRSQMACRTLEPNSECQDPRLTPMKDIYTIHFTAVCGKPNYCFQPMGQCLRFLRAWHKARYDLEIEWAKRYGNYTGLTQSNGTYYPTVYFGHCRGRLSYIPIDFPPLMNTFI